MKITRREALRLGLAGSGVLLSPLAFPGAAQAQGCHTKQCQQDPDAPNLQTPKPGWQPTPFEQPFHRLEELEPVATTLVKTEGDGPQEREIRYYQITLRKQQVGVCFAPDGHPLKTAEAWIYQGSGSKPTQPWIVGPVIRQPRSGDRVEHLSVVRFINELGKDEQNTDICASVHLHGMASLPQYDGYAEDLIPPGYCKDYYYPNNRASTLWYHDHAVHKTARNVYMGMAGMYIVQYEADDFANPNDFGCLPKGEFEVPLILQDKTFEVSEKNTNQWKLVLNDRGQRGVYSSVVLANGVPWPRMTVKRRKYYFRILNASPSRTYQLALSRQAKGQSTAPDPLVVIGSDAGLLPAPVYLSGQNNPLRIGVAERYGVIIDFAQFPKDVKQVFLRNVPFPSNLGPEPDALIRFDLSDEPAGDDPSYIPNPLGKPLPPLQEMINKAACNRTLQFGRGRDWMINGKTWSCDRVEAYPHLGGIEIWELVNNGGWVHPVHIHLVDFRVISRNGQPPLPYEQGWKDVVVVKETERVRVIARFGPHLGKYMIHCHNLVHEDHDMMTQFEVVSVPAGSPSPACGIPLSTDKTVKYGPSPLCAPAVPCAEAPPLGTKMAPPNCP